MTMVPDEPAWSEDDALLHVIAQRSYHDPAFIVGNREGLTRLRDALNAALEAPSTTQKADAMCNDGECYRVCVRCETEREMELAQLGYTYEWAGGRVWPHWMTVA